jgi:hypothetical protein
MPELLSIRPIVWLSGCEVNKSARVAVRPSDRLSPCPVAGEQNECGCHGVFQQQDHGHDALQVVDGEQGSSFSFRVVVLITLARTAW